MSFLTCGGAASILRFGLLTQELFKRATKATISFLAEEPFQRSNDASSVIWRWITSPKASSNAAIAAAAYSAAAASGRVVRRWRKAATNAPRAPAAESGCVEA